MTTVEMTADMSAPGEELPRLDLGIEVHPAAKLFPMLGEDELAALTDDIAKNGQRQPCILYQGKLLDGRNRWEACRRLHVEPITEELPEDQAPYDYVISANVHRRHLAASQLAMAAGRLKGQFALDAKERQRAAGGDKRSPQAQSDVENFPEPIRDRGRSREKAAELMHVSDKLVDLAETVLKQGSPELIWAVDSGDVAVSKAAKIARTVPKEDQLRVAVEPRAKGVKMAAPRDRKEPEAGDYAREASDDPRPAAQEPVTVPAEQEQKVIQNCWWLCLTQGNATQDQVANALLDAVLAAQQRWPVETRKSGLGDMIRKWGEQIVTSGELKVERSKADRNRSGQQAC